MASANRHVYLFGGDKPWQADAWIASDDRVRGGKSQSYLDPAAGSSAALFHGHLDIKTLGGAGFASQRSPDPQRWDLTGCKGLRLKVSEGDGKKYTLILKDEILPKRPDGREQSTVSWEYDFACREAAVADVPWSDFKPTYRGKPKPDAAPLDLANIRRISIMMRSFFGEQEGPFRLRLEHIAAVESDEESRLSPSEPLSEARSADSGSSLGKAESTAGRTSWFDCLRAFFR